MVNSSIGRLRRLLLAAPLAMTFLATAGLPMVWAPARRCPRRTPGCRVDHQGQFVCIPYKGVELHGADVVATLSVIAQLFEPISAPARFASRVKVPKLSGGA